MQMPKCHLATAGQTTEFCVNQDKATGMPGGGEGWGGEGSWHFLYEQDYYLYPTPALPYFLFSPKITC